MIDNPVAAISRAQRFESLRPPTARRSITFVY
jgi:hypothetical protein